MKLEDQVVSLEIARELKELWVKQESLFAWWISPDSKQLIYKHNAPPNYLKTDRYYSAFTVAELGEMLPEGVFKYKKRDCFVKHFNDYGTWFTKIFDENKGEFIEPSSGAETEANSRGQMLLYLLKNNLIKKGE